MPAIEIAGLCLPLKPQKERGYNWLFKYQHMAIRCSITAARSNKTWLKEMDGGSDDNGLELEG